MNHTQNNNFTGNDDIAIYRQSLADSAVSNEASAVERIRARIALLVSYISDDVMRPEEQPAFREHITGLVSALDNPEKHIIMQAYRTLRGLEDRIYVPLRRAAADQFDSLRRNHPDMTGEMLLKTLIGTEIDEYRARNQEASQGATLIALMRSSPRADLLISMIRGRNDEYPATVFSWRPLAWPLLGM